MYNDIIGRTLTQANDSSKFRELVLILSPYENGKEFSIRIIENDSMSFVEGIFLNLDLRSFLFDYWKKIENISELTPVSKQVIHPISDHMKNDLLKLTKQLKNHQFVPPKADPGEIVDYSIPCYTCYFNGSRQKAYCLEAPAGCSKGFTQDVYELFVGIAMDLKLGKFNEHLHSLKTARLLAASRCSSFF